jgi:hypothetical protein
MSRLRHRPGRGKPDDPKSSNWKTILAVLPGLLGIIRELIAIWRK